MKTIPCSRLTASVVSIIFGCCLVLNSLTAQLVVSITPTHITCFGAANGQAEATPTGREAPYAFAWSNGGITQSIQNLAVGDYAITVTDALQQTATAITSITQPALLGVTIAGQSQLCAVAPDGWTLAVPYGGVGPYSFQWSNGPTTAQNNNLVAGMYLVTVTDANGCTKNGAYALNYWAEGLWTSFSVVDAICGLETGSATLDFITGTAPYQFQWSNGDTTQNITNLAAGTYTLLVSDVNGCAPPLPVSVQIGENNPTPTDIFLSTPLCLNEPGIFTMDIPAGATGIQWEVNSPIDQITQGQGTDSIHVHWVFPGAKTVTLQYMIENAACTTVVYHLTVAVCADAKEATLEDISVSPNPFSAVLQIAQPNDSEGEIWIVLSDVSGKIYAEQPLDAGTITMPTATIPAGVYCLKIKTEYASLVWKLIKQ